MEGDYSLADGLALFQRVAATARERGARLVLVDLVGLVGDIPDLDRYDLGKEGAEILGHVERLAVVRAPGYRYTGFAVDVARNRGLNIRVFTDRSEAIEWLTGK